MSALSKGKIVGPQRIYLVGHFLLALLRQLGFCSIELRLFLASGRHPKSQGQQRASRHMRSLVLRISPPLSLQVLRE